MVKLVATDIDGTFLRSDDTFDQTRFEKILSRMKEIDDIEMLKFCEQSYAMQNATDSVKAAAKNICPPNNEDGVLVTLEKILR